MHSPRDSISPHENFDFRDTWCIIPRWNPWYTELHILPNQLREDYSLVSPETNVFEIELNREGEIEQSYMYKAFGSFRFVSDLYIMRDILKSSNSDLERAVCDGWKWHVCWDLKVN